MFDELARGASDVRGPVQNLALAARVAVRSGCSMDSGMPL